MRRQGIREVDEFPSAASSAAARSKTNGAFNFLQADFRPALRDSLLQHARYTSGWRTRCKASCTS